MFSSLSLKQLGLLIPLDLHESSEASWCLPALKTLHLRSCNLPDSCFSLPALTTLRIGWSKLPHSSWNLPFLTTLYLYSVKLPEYTYTLFSQLVNLQNLSLLVCSGNNQVCDIVAPQLKNLTVRSFNFSTRLLKSTKLVISAPKLYNLRCSDLNPIVLSASNCVKRVHVEIKEYDIRRYDLELVDLMLKNMFEGAPNAEILMVTCGTIKVCMSKFRILSLFFLVFY